MRSWIRMGLLCVWMWTPARADLVVTLAAFDADDEPVTGRVAAETELSIDVLLSVDEVDDPLNDVRTLVLDFGFANAGIRLRQFTWTFDSLRDGGLYRQTTDLPTPEATYTGLARSEERILDLVETPVRVAILEVTVDATGGLSAIGDPLATSSAALFDAGFSAPRRFSLAEGNLQGEPLVFLVPDEEPPDDQDSDGDGVPDSADAFPDDPAETEDTDGDSVGDNADAFPDDPEETEDTDGDGVGDHADAFPSDADETQDTDGDGAGDNTDPDDDGDGFDDGNDAFPLDPTEWLDSDGDGIGDNLDSFPLDPTRGIDTTHGGNTGPRVIGSLCGAALIGPGLAAVCALAGMRRGRQHRAAEGPGTSGGAGRVRTDG